VHTVSLRPGLHTWAKTSYVQIHTNLTLTLTHLLPACTHTARQCLRYKNIMWFASDMAMPIHLGLAKSRLYLLKVWQVSIVLLSLFSWGHGDTCFPGQRRILPLNTTDASCISKHTPNHIFVSEATSKPIALCVPQKNGNIFWSMLPYRSTITDAAFKKIPMKHGFKDITQHMSGKTELSKRSGIVRHDIMTGDTYLRVMIVRNPYVRLLSGYIDKILMDKHGGQKFKKHFKKSLPTSFEAFVDWMLEFRLHQTSSKMAKELTEYFNRHIIAPQSLHCLLHCGVDYTFLKEEETHEWYPDLIHTLGLENKTSSGWGVEECYLPYNSTCDTKLWVRKGCHIHFGASHTHTTGPVHSHGTVSKIHTFYTPKAARVVTDLFKDDILNFDYPTWDGIEPFSII